MLTDFQAQIQGYEAVSALVPITGLRWTVAHVPYIRTGMIGRCDACFHRACARDGAAGRR